MMTDGCQLDYIWNELLCGVRGHTCERLFSLNLKWMSPFLAQVFEMGRCTSVIRMFKVGRHTLKSALSAGRLYKAMEGGSYCSSSDCSCLATKSILSLTLEPTSSLEFQCLLKTNWGIQPCELSMSGFSDFLFTFHYCWISWTVVCDSNKPPLCIY